MALAMINRRVTLDLAKRALYSSFEKYSSIQSTNSFSFSKKGDKNLLNESFNLKNVVRSQQLNHLPKSVVSNGIHSQVEQKSDMFCFQCEQTRDGVGCKTWGVCGKDPQTAALQDLLIHSIKGLSQYALLAQRAGIQDEDTDYFVQEAIFATLTNVNFDSKSIQKYINETVRYRKLIKSRYEEAMSHSPVRALENLPSNHFTDFEPAESLKDLADQGKEIGIETRRVGLEEDIFSLQELLTYGIKGTAAYAAHANAVNQRDKKISHFIYEAFDYMSKPVEDQNLNELLGLCLECGEVNIRAMEILNTGHCDSFGKPEPSLVRTSPVKGKCIAVSGHDLKDLYEVLVATEGTGINVYTHGELLPAHGYPQLKKFKHLVGNYGGPWQLQKMEFAAFPGPILVTTNCILEPKPSYQDRIYSANAVGHPKVRHLEDRNWQPLVDQALSMEGFTEDAAYTQTMTGFGHDAVLSVADQVVDLVKAGKVKRFFLIGGCDGFEGERSYYRDLALSIPKDAVVLTLACGKYRFNKEFDKFGIIEGTNLPRLMDIGQCNDAYSAIRIASALAQAFDTDVNSLPLSLVISWFEQKAVAVLLSLLHLGIQNIRIGPKLPAFVTPNILKVLVEKFKLTPISGPDNVARDLELMMNNNISRPELASAKP